MHYSFIERHFLLPTFLFLFTVIIYELYDFDLIVADWLYALEGNQWLLRSHYITKIVLHDRAQDLSKLIGVLFLILAILSHFIQRLSPYKKGLWLLFITFAVSAALVAIGKAISHVDCPWDLQRYGGTRPYLRNFDTHPGTYKFGRCFPSGHASGGYGLVGIYFFLLHYLPKWKWLGLGAAIFIGLIYGFTQQLRGGHFLSHDIWTFYICWVTALLTYCILFKCNTQVQTDRI